MAKFGIGQAVPRTEDPRLLTGRGKYTDDVSLPGQAAAHFLRSPLAHAKIARLEVSAARASDGVIGIVTGADLATDGIGTLPVIVGAQNRDGSAMPKPPRPALADDRVRHVGNAVVLVVAETLAQAKDAAELIEIDYEPLPPIVDPATALDPDSPKVWDLERGNLVFDWEMGDSAAVDAAMSAAAQIVSLDLVNNRVAANSMEGRACLASYDAGDGRFTLYVSSQGVRGLRGILAEHIFKLPPDRFRVLTTDVGGGFGMKIFLYPEYVATLYAARKFARPVKWTAERTEGLISDSHARDNLSRMELGLDADGKMLAMRMSTIANMGAYISDYAPFVATAAGCPMLTGLYDIPAAYVNVKGVFTNTQPVDAYRGAGRPEASYAIERLVDAAARQTGIPAPELRRRNYIPPDAMPHNTSLGLTYDSGDFAGNMDEALEIAGWSGLEERRAEARARGKLRGLGLATYVEACGGAPVEGSRIEMRQDGTVTVYMGNQSNGQGHETAYKQIIGEFLGLDPDAVTFIQGDSDIVPQGFTGGSRAIPVGGVAIANASEQILEKARLRAAELMETAVADIEVQRGNFTVAGTDRSMTLTEIARTSEAEVAFDESTEFTPEAMTFPNGAHLCEVEIDRDTGRLEIVNYTVVDDFGRVLNPLLVAGQVHGGIAQGMGQALMEEAVFDRDSGQLLAGSFMDYAMPRADNLPTIRFKYNEIPCRTNPLGIKGAGEAGAIGAPPAVINAIVDALSDYGVTHIDMPATSEKIWRLIQSHSPRAAAE